MGSLDLSTYSNGQGMPSSTWRFSTPSNHMRGTERALHFLYFLLYFCLSFVLRWERKKEISLSTKSETRWRCQYFISSTWWIHLHRAIAMILRQRNPQMTDWALNWRIARLVGPVVHPMAKAQKGLDMKGEWSEKLQFADITRKNFIVPTSCETCGCQIETMSALSLSFIRTTHKVIRRLLS